MKNSIILSILFFGVSFVGSLMASENVSSLENLKQLNNVTYIKENSDYKNFLQFSMMRKMTEAGARKNLEMQDYLLGDKLVEVESAMREIEVLTGSRAVIPALRVTFIPAGGATLVDRYHANVARHIGEYVGAEVVTLLGAQGAQGLLINGQKPSWVTAYSYEVLDSIQYVVFHHQGYDVYTSPDHQFIVKLPTNSSSDK
ncbi:MAG: hypothetical protein Q8K75_05805 [Chlamydiales bacterium]|nr:hypothetical protein [Chlamydiales bacterium]